MTEKESFAEGLREALEEVRAWKHGELALEVRIVEPMPAERIRAIRRKVARSAKEFEARFGIPAATVNNWEQGRRAPDPAARLLLKVIEQNPEAVERAAHSP
ncbi:MAG: helix-turn-helix domain-containing protein [Acetobacteraceae bacterium]|nr:helix-turn-helix domain-containing protein [Acetobacteraceae bacterium]